MRVIDITMELNDRVAVYKSDPHVHVDPYTTVEENGYAVTELVMGSHSGTHIDAPSHVLAHGRTVLDIPLDLLIGKCYVADVDDFDTIPRDTRRLLCKGAKDPSETLTYEQSEELVRAGVRVFGTDGMSIGGDEVHRLLLENSCVILENLVLGHVDPGDYVLCALPLKVAADGAPIRACLLPKRS